MTEVFEEEASILNERLHNFELRKLRGVNRSHVIHEIPFSNRRTHSVHSRNQKEEEGPKKAELKMSTNILIVPDQALPKASTRMPFENLRKLTQARADSAMHPGRKEASLELASTQPKNNGSESYDK